MATPRSRPSSPVATTGARPCPRSRPCLPNALESEHRWPEPVLPRDWANLYVQTFNEYMRNRTKEEVVRKQSFLEETLRQSDVVEIQKSIYRLIEAQTAIMMLANAREEYVLEIIDPAARPYRSVNMSRKKKLVVGSIVGLMLSTFAVLGITLLLQLWNSFQSARALHLQNNSTNTDIS